MTSANVAERAAGTIDFTMMYATHDAFRSDLDWLAAAAAAGKAGIPQVRAGWPNFKTQPLLLHSVEDSHLCPGCGVLSPAARATSPCSTRCRPSMPRSTRCSPPSIRR